MAKKKTDFIRMAILFLIFVIITEASVILFYKIKDHAKTVGILTQTNSRVYINDTKIPAYGWNGRVYIAAEDLEPFGVSVINDVSDDIVIERSNSDNDPENAEFSKIAPGSKIKRTRKKVIIGDEEQEHLTSLNYTIIPAESLKAFSAERDLSDNVNYRYTLSDTITTAQIIEGIDPKEDIRKPGNTDSSGKQSKTYRNSSQSQTSPSKTGKIIVLDPGHGKSSGSMSAEEKERYGWVQNSSGQWGEWRHWKLHSIWEDCKGDGCSKRVTPNGACWYPIGNGDRDIEPDINLQNCLAAKKYLEQKGYTVRLTRLTNDENPSITRRLKYCYTDNPDNFNYNDLANSSPDAAAFVCIHSNAGGGSGSAYIELEGPYDQKGISSSYASDGNTLGKTINDEIVASTSMSRHGSGSIGGEPELIAFCKCPVTCGYLEIGFFDNQNDLSILKSESDGIGAAIATGIDNYLKNKQ